MNNWAFSTDVSAWKAVLLAVACPAWRRMASLSVKDWAPLIEGLGDALHRICAAAAPLLNLRLDADEV